MANGPIQRGESPDYAKLSAFGKKRTADGRDIQRGESPDKAQLPAFGRKHAACAHDETPAIVRKDKLTARAPRRVRPMRFVSLHHHSTYSFLDGYQLPDAHARRIAELNGSALAMTEHGNLMSHAKFEASVMKSTDANGNPNEAYGIKPIFGIELYCGHTDEARRSQTKNHLTILSKTEEGYRNLLQLVSKSWMEGYYYEPTVSGRMLADHRAGLAVLSGCQGSLLFTSLMGGKHVSKADAGFKRARGVAESFKRSFGDSYFIEVQAFPELSDTCAANPQLARIARELGIPLVATLDCHYTLPTEKEVQKVLHAVRNNGTVEEVARSWGYSADLCPPLSDRHIVQRLVQTGLTRQEAIEAVLMTEAIAQDCNVTLPRLPMVKYPVPVGVASANALMWTWLRAGWKFRNLDRMSAADRDRYAERVKYEMSIIESKDFVDYFLIVSDLVKFAKDADIGVGPGRGSAAGSLVCWLLRITEVNPMQFPHLVFERFIDITREDLPDIDLDFESDRRGEVIDYEVAKFGRDCVSQIGTFTKYKSKNSLDDVARVFRVPGFEVSKIKDVLLERSSGDLRASATIQDTLEQFDIARDVVDRFPDLMRSSELEGNVKGFGVHAAGMVVSNSDIRSVCAILRRKVKGKDTQVVAVDKYDAEYLGLLKIDLLGLTALDALVQMCRMLGKKSSYMYEIPIEDELTIRGFKNNDVIGIFQYEGRAMRMVNGSIRPDNFDEICHITALARPGPLHNGAVADYVDIKRGAKVPTILHPAMEKITAFTQYQVVYQEQILQIVREIGAFEWTHAAYIRKIISRKLGDAEFNKQWGRFWDGARTLHERTDFPPMSEEMARDIWGLLTTSGSYAFNAAHSVSYGYIAWWTQFFKQHHTDVFYTSMLDRAHKKSGGDSSNAKASVQSKARLDPQLIMLNDAVNHGFKILPMSVPLSGATWTLGDEKMSLRPGLGQIPGIGDSMAEKIMSWRQERKTPPGDNWNSLIEVSGIGPKKLELIKQFAESDDPFKIERLDRIIREVKADLPRLGLPSPSHVAIEVPYEGGEDIEVVWIGVVVHKNLRDIFEVNRARSGEELNPDEVKDPHLNEWMLLAGWDGTDLLSLRITRWKYPKWKDLLWKIKPNDDVVLVRGVKPSWRTAREIFVKDIWVLQP